MQKLSFVSNDKKYAIGLMSGTSVDGIDAALVEISGFYKNTQVKLVEFITLPFEKTLRERILRVAKGDFGGSEELCKLNFLLGELSADACEFVCEKAGVDKNKIAFVGSHGQTVFHIPQDVEYMGKTFKSTLQIGEPSVICERLSFPVVSDFRVRDISAGGFGAPLVPYTEFLLYRQEKRTVALQNIGGIGNITILPKGANLDDVYAFDTGAGNMIMDAVVEKITNGNMNYDDGGKLAKQGKISESLLEYMLDDEYLYKQPPKTTGREYYGEQYVAKLCQKASELNLSLLDVLATATLFTAKSIEIAVRRFCLHCPELFIVGGGGSYNPTLMAHIKACLPECEVCTNEEVGFDSGAKEAIAFAVLANERLHEVSNNALGATGARHEVVMGKVSI